MRKFLLSTIALMMALVVSAKGLGNGVDEANAVDFNWDDGHKPALSAGSWYRVSLDRLKSEANDPTLALYLTNLTDETATVKVNVKASVTVMGKTESATKTLNYSIGGKQLQLWSVKSFNAAGREMSLKQLMDLGLTEVYLQLTSNKEIALSAKVYKTEDIKEDACTKAIDFDWSGVTVPVGEQWYYLNLTEVKANNNKLKFVVENSGAAEAHVGFELSLDCPVSAIVMDKEWTLAAGAKQEDEFGRIFLKVLKEDYVYLKLTNDQPVTLRVEEEVVVVDPTQPDPYADFNCGAASLLELDKDLNLTAGKHVYKVKRADLLAGRDHATEFYVTNATGAAANLTVQVAVECPVESTIDQTLVIGAGETVVKPVKDNVLKAFTSEWVYVRFITDQDLSATVGMRETSLCGNAKPFDWTTGASLVAGETQWYKMDITTLKQNKQHAELSFINYSSEVALVSLDVAFECDGEVIPVMLPIPGGLTVPNSKLPVSVVLDYQLLVRSPKDHIYVGVTTDSHIELTSKVKDAIAADPTPCENALNPVHGEVYTHPAGDTKWYKISLDLLKSQKAYSSLYLANTGDKRAHVTLGLVHDCQYVPGMKLTLPLPAGFEVGALAPNLLGRLVEALSSFEGTYNKVDSKEVYLEVYSDQTLEFGLDVINATTNPCLRTDLKPFDWDKGIAVEADKAAWYDLDITTIKNTGKHVKLTFTNPTESLVCAAGVVSVDCPAKLTMPMLLPVPAGTSVDHVIDYSIFKAADVEHLYVGVSADGALELAAETIDATASNPAGCEGATLVESGKVYTQNAGTQWYQFPMSMLDELGDAARLTFKNWGNQTAKLSAGVTVDCQYGIVNYVPVKVPQGVDMSLSVPKRVINKLRGMVDADVTNFYLQLTSDQKISLGVNMQAVSVEACVDAVDFDWANWEANGLQIQANQDVWYKVNLDYPLEKLEKGEDIVISLSNNNDVDVDVEVAVSPTCPALLSLEKFFTIPANTPKLQKVISYEEATKLLSMYNQYVYDSGSNELLGKYDAYVFFQKLSNNLGRYGQYVPLNHIQSLLDRYGAHLTFTGIQELINNYEKYISYDELKEQLELQKEYTSVDEILALVKKYGKYIPVVDMEKILNDYEQYLPYAGVMLQNMRKYISKDDVLKVIDYCKQYIPIEEFKQYFERLKQYLPEDNTCYVNIKSKGDLVVEDDTIPETPEGCDAAVLLDHNKTYNLRELPTGWYKVGLNDIHANRLDLTLKLNNDLGADTTITIHAYKTCDDVKPLATRARRMKEGLNTESIPYQLIQQYASAMDTLYIYMESGVHTCGTLSCESAIPFPWNTTVVVNKEVWYEINVEDILAKKQSIKATISNPSNLLVSAEIDYAISCPVVESEVISKPQEFKAGCMNDSTITALDLQDQLDMLGADPDAMYLHICPTGSLKITTVLIDTVPVVNPEQHPCELATDTIQWDAPIHLEANTDKWYVVDVTTAAESDSDIELVVKNGPTETTVNVEYGVVCPSDDWTSIKPYTIAANATATAIITQDDMDVAGAVDYVYVHVITTGAIDVEADTVAPAKQYDYKTITDYICDGLEYLDPITGKLHTIASLVPASQTWNDTVTVSELLDSVYTFVITPIVAPEELTVATLAAIPGATPVLNAGAMVDVTGTEDAIKAYYAGKDNEAIADVVNVTWTSGVGVQVPADATTHTMTLLVEAGCEFEVESVLEFPIVIEKDTLYETVTDFVCDGENYTDPVTNEVHRISSMITASQTWQSTKDEATKVTIYTYKITPIVAPVVMTEPLLATIPGATPVLEAGKVVDVTASVAAITKYYADRDLENIADINSVVWTVGAGVTLDCNATTHDMTLEIEAGCNFKVSINMTLPVAPATADETILPAVPVSICESELPYQWSVNGHSVVCEKAGTYYDTVTVNCTKTISVLELTVDLVTENELSAVEVSVCESELPYQWSVAGTTISCAKADTYKHPVVDGCTKTIHVLKLTVYATPDPVVEYDTICPGTTKEWYNDLSFTEAGTYHTTLANENGCAYDVTLHLYVADADNDPNYDNLDAVGKYGDRLLLLNLNRLNELVALGTIPAVPTAANVTWYRVEGERDLVAEIITGTAVNPDAELENSHSYYYNKPDGSPLEPGKYYALMKLEGVGGPCITWLRSAEVELGASADLTPQLVPTIADPNADLRILNLNPSSVTEVRVYNTSGELVSTYTASQASEFIFKAATMPGYYMVEVQSNGEQTTLRYIVK